MYVQINDSVSDLLKKCKEAWNAGHQNQATATEDFCGKVLRTWEEIENAVRIPDQEALDEVFGMVYELDQKADIPQPKDRKRRRVWAEDDGDEFDRERLLNGQDPWLSTTRTLVTAPQHVCLLSDVTTSWMVNHKDILWRGAACLTIADLLEENGYRCEIWLVNKADKVLGKGRHNAEDGFFATNIKRSEDPMDLPLLINCMTGWFFRRVIFQSYHIPRINVPKYYGLQHGFEKDDPQVLELVGNAKPIVLKDIWSLENAKRRVIEVITSINQPEERTEEQ